MLYVINGRFIEELSYSEERNAIDHMASFNSWCDSEVEAELKKGPVYTKLHTYALKREELEELAVEQAFKYFEYHYKPTYPMMEFVQWYAGVPLIGYKLLNDKGFITTYKTYLNEKDYVYVILPFSSIIYNNQGVIIESRCFGADRFFTLYRGSKVLNFGSFYEALKAVTSDSGVLHV